MESKLDFSTNRNRVLMALSILVFLLLLVPKEFIAYELDEKYVTVTFASCIMIVLAIVVKIDSNGRATGLVNTMILLLCSGVSFSIMQTSQEFVISDVEWTLFFAFNFFICAILLLAGYCLTGRFRFSIVFSLTVITIYAIVGFYVLTFRGEALLPMDILASATALSVADGFSFQFTGIIFLILLQYIAALSWASKTVSKARTPKKQLQIRLSVTLLCTFGVLLFVNGSPEEDLVSWNFSRFLNGYPFEIAAQTKLLNIKAPTGYDPSAVANIVNNDGQSQLIATTSDNFAFEIENSNTSSQLPQNPNIIIVMNETFSDLRLYRDFETNIPVMPFIDELRKQENVISGFVEVNVFGGGTCDSEYSILTGNSTAFLPASARPYQLYMEENAPSIAANLRLQGYSTYAIHPGVRSAWNRDVAYEKLGFDQYFSNEHFPQDNLVRDIYVGDDKTYEQIIHLYETKGDVPLFIHDVTIQNHCGYSEHSTNGLEDVRLMGLDNAYPDVEQYLSLLHRSDADFQKLIEYFENADEPTIILFFGDHQAQIDTAFYEELMGKPKSEWSAEEAALQYQVPYFIWANYDIDESSDDNTSIHSLSPKLLSQTGVNQSAYFNYLNRLSRSDAIITKSGALKSDGTRQPLKEAEKQNITIENYRKVLYNNMIDVKNRRNELYYVNESQPEPLKSF